MSVLETQELRFSDSMGAQENDICTKLVTEWMLIVSFEYLQQLWKLRNEYKTTKCTVHISSHLKEKSHFCNFYQELAWNINNGKESFKVHAEHLFPSCLEFYLRDNQRVSAWTNPL